MKLNKLESRLVKILEAVTQRVTERVDSLDPVFKFKTGIEGWFKVEFVYALERQGEKVFRLQNKGPDVLLAEGLQIELKGASDFNPTYLSSGALKDNVPCIFLGSGEEIYNIERLRANPQIHIIDIKIIQSKHSWAVGCIIPSSLSNGVKADENGNYKYHNQSPTRKSNINVDPNKTQMSEQLRNLVTKSPKMAGKLDEILSVGGNWEELVAKAKIEANKIGNKVHYLPSVLRGHIRYRSVDQKKTDYLRNYDINDEGVFPRNQK